MTSLEMMVKGIIPIQIAHGSPIQIIDPGRIVLTISIYFHYSLQLSIGSIHYYTVSTSRIYPGTLKFPCKDRALLAEAAKSSCTEQVATLESQHSRERRWDQHGLFEVRCHQQKFEPQNWNSTCKHGGFLCSIYIVVVLYIDRQIQIDTRAAKKGHNCWSLIKSRKLSL